MAPVYKIQFRDVTTGKVRTIETTDEEAALSTAYAVASTGDEAVVELRVRVRVVTRLSTEWADITQLVKVANRYR